MKLVIQREHDIEHCGKCPYGRARGRADSRCAEDWYCTAVAGSKLISAYVEWDDQLPAVPPEWCPLRSLANPVVVCSDGRLPVITA